MEFIFSWGVHDPVEEVVCDDEEDGKCAEAVCFFDAYFIP